MLIATSDDGVHSWLIPRIQGKTATREISYTTAVRIHPSGLVSCTSRVNGTSGRWVIPREPVHVARSLLLFLSGVSSRLFEQALEGLTLYFSLPWCAL